MEAERLEQGTGPDQLVEQVEGSQRAELAAAHEQAELQVLAQQEQEPQAVEQAEVSAEVRELVSA